VRENGLAFAVVTHHQGQIKPIPDGDRIQIDDQFIILGDCLAKTSNQENRSTRYDPYAAYQWIMRFL